MIRYALSPLVLVLLLAAAAVADEDGSDREEAIDRVAAPSRLGAVIVTAARRPEPAFPAPFSTEVVSAEDLSGELAPRTLADALENLTGVMVQKTGYGQASPYLRGLTGFRTLLLVDGIRLNNANFRDGPNQYLATVDNLSLRRAELVRGTSSVLYGTDSMGGTLNLIPRAPHREEGRYSWGGRIYERLSAAERSTVTRLSAEGGFGSGFGFLAGVDRKVFGDLRAGDGRLDDTAYDEWDGDLRLEWNPGDRLSAVLGYQHVGQDDVPRTHKTIHARPWHGTTVGDELRRDLDQTRDLLYVRTRLQEPGAGVGEAVLTLSWQRQDEERYRVRTRDRYDRQGVTVDTLGVALQASADSSLGRWTCGLDASRDLVDSFSQQLTATGRVISTGIQGPVADDATWDRAAIFLEGRIPLADELQLAAGIRGARVATRAGRVEDPSTGEPISLSDRWSAVVGSLRLSCTALEGVALYGGASQGFRAPNLSDLTRLDTARSNEIETPSPGLDPERTLTFEIGAKVDLGGLRGEVAVYRTELRDFIQRFPTGATVGGAIEVTKANIGDGWIHGFDATGELDLGAGFTTFGGVSFVVGKADTYPTSDRVVSREYLDRLPPLSGRFGAEWRHGSGVRVRGLLRMAAKADRLSPRDEEDTQRIPPGGTPGYGVLDLAMVMPVTTAVDLAIGVDNVLDRAWRIHGSGQNEPGRNLWMSVVVRF